MVVANPHNYYWLVWFFYILYELVLLFCFLKLGLLYACLVWIDR